MRPLRKELYLVFGIVYLICLVTCPVYTLLTTFTIIGVCAMIFAVMVALSIWAISQETLYR